MKTLADFDFSFQPSLQREQIDSLHTLGFLERRENVILLGPPGWTQQHRCGATVEAASRLEGRSIERTLPRLSVMDARETAWHLHCPGVKPRADLRHRLAVVSNKRKREQRMHDSVRDGHREHSCRR